MEPLTIANFVDGRRGDVITRNLRVDVEPLCQLLLQPQFQDLPVIVISINGGMRMGKSFLLNKILSFLKAGGEQGWIDLPLDFEWNKRLPSSVTGRIEIYPEVLPINVGEQKLAVILVDTQQTFGDSNLIDNYKILDLSSLFSSIIIYNDILSDEQNSQSLHDFTKIGQFAGGNDIDNNDFQFGNCIMLYRDWGHASEFPYGFYPQQNPRTNLLWQRLLTEESEYIRTTILNTFLDFSFYTMASPGNKYPHLPEYRQSTAWDTSFRSCVIDFVENLFSERYILQGAVKTVGGQEILAKDYVQYIRSWTRVITNNEYSLGLVDAIDTTAEIYYKKLLERSWEMYTNKFAEFRLRGFEGGVENFHEKTLDLIQRSLWTNVSFRMQKRSYFQILEIKADIFLENVRPIIDHKANAEKRKETGSSCNIL